MDPVFFRVQEMLPDIGGMEERLGRNAADMQAAAPQLRVFFD
jgi:hypothetical protein